MSYSIRKQSKMHLLMQNSFRTVLHFQDFFPVAIIFCEFFNNIELIFCIRQASKFQSECNLFYFAFQVLLAVQVIQADDYFGCRAAGLTCPAIVAYVFIQAGSSTNTAPLLFSSHCQQFKPSIYIGGRIHTVLSSFVCPPQNVGYILF